MVMNLQFVTYNEQLIYCDGLQLVFNHFSNHPHYVFLVFLVFLYYAALLKKGGLHVEFIYFTVEV